MALLMYGQDEIFLIFPDNIQIMFSSYEFVNRTNAYMDSQKTALVVFADGAEEVETLSVVDVLRRGGVHVTIATLNDDLNVKCAHGVTILADALLKDTTDLFDAVVIPGGYNGAIACGKSALVGEVLTKHAQNNKVIAAICAGPGFVLAKHGIINADTPITGYPGTLPDTLTNTKKDMVVNYNNGAVITGKGPVAAMKFAFEILKTLTSQTNADKIASDMLVQL